jgi:biopolymer transport protein TolQ
MTPDLAVAATASDFSMWALFLQATLTVKLVMLLLLFMSVYAWAIIIQKALNYRKARAEIDAFEADFWSAEALDDLSEQLTAQNRLDGMAGIFVAGMTEWRRSQRDDGAIIANATSRIERVMDLAIARQVEAHQKGLGFLATTGSTAPFIGLFGTVWGIMHAFQQIALSQNTNLAVVAPGIAEALLATGLGLLAAIPAVASYNRLSSDSDALTARYEAFADEFSTLLSRQLEG